MKRIACTVAIIVAFSLTAFASKAQESALDNAMQTITEKAADVNTFTADFQIRARSLQMLSGTIEFKLPGAFHVQMLTTTGAAETISDGTTAWMLMPHANRIVQIDTARVRAALVEVGIGTIEPTPFIGVNIARPLGMIRKEKATLVGSERIGEEEVWEIEGPADIGTAMNAPLADKIRLYISKNDGLLRKFEVSSGEAIIQSGTYSNIKINPDLSDDKFSYTPPKNATVNDDTEKVIKALKMTAERQSKTQGRKLDNPQEPPTGSKSER